MEYIGQFLFWLNDNSGILTFLTVIATFFTCWCSYKSARATRDQVAEMRRQFKEEIRANIDVEFLYEKRTYYGLRFVNRGRCTAQQVKIIFENSFIDSIEEVAFADMLRKQRGKICIIGVEQHYDVFIGSNKYRDNSHKVPAKGVVAVCCRRSGRFDCVPGGTGRIEKTGEDTGVKKFDAELRASKKAGSLRVGAAGQPFEMIGAVP